MNTSSVGGEHGSRGGVVGVGVGGWGVGTWWWESSSMVAAVVGVRLGIVELASLVVRVLGGGLPLVQGGRT